MRNRGFLSLLVLITLIASSTVQFTVAQPLQQAAALSADALVLVNEDSVEYPDFEHYVQPYLDHFGIPYTLLDISDTAVESDLGDYAVIIVGHRQLDPDDMYLDTTEEGYISAAVSAGTGLVNFDNDLSIGGSTPRYQFLQDIFDFGYLPPSTGSGVTFTSETGGGLQINCWEDDHQYPVLTTFTNSSLFVDTDGEWDEFLWLGNRDYPGVFAGIPEASDGSLETFHCFGDVPNGTYDVVANLYHSRDWRYYWGYSAADPQANSFDVTTGPSGDFAEFTIDTVTITDGSFDIYMNYGEDLGGTTFPYFGWSWIRLVPTDTPPPVMHYITERHAAGESITTGSMAMAGVTLPEGVNALAMTGSQPFLAVTTYGTGRAVQWGSYDWMSHSVKGPVYGLDDLVWRSIVWAARKPFVMQGLPPFVTMRVDDESGPFWWIHIANEFDIKPWAGLFYHNVDATEAADLSALVHAGQATASVHAKSGIFFYYNHGVGDFSNEVIAANYAEATAWHETHDIPISQFVLPHYYEFGTNVFQGLSDWGVEFVGTMMDPGNGYGAPWIMNGPYRLYETGGSSGARPVYYADFMSIPGHPEFDGQFFNCVTEIRDDAGYEWYPSSDIAVSIGRGTRQTERAFDSMALATLFTHGQHVRGIPQENWRAILQGITDNLEPYDPIYVTLDHACQYVRAMYTSDINSSSYDPATRQLTTDLGGETDMPTMFYLFTEQEGDIRHILIDVPTFSGSATVDYTLAGPLDHVVVTPASATVATGGSQQFAAQGFDVDGNPIPNLPFTWSVVSGGGTIDGNGLFTAGLAPGTYADTVQASYGGVSGYASVELVAPALDHFTFEPIASPQYVDAPFEVTVTARDISGNPLVGYFGSAALSDTTGTLDPTTASFSAGVWTGEVAIGEAAHDVILTAADGGATGASDPIEILPMPMFYEVTSPAYTFAEGEAFSVTVTAYQGTTINLWEDDHQDPVLETTSDWTLLETTPGEWTEFHYSSRPFPSVMAAHDEYELYGLPLMRFYANGIPNGEYEVIANLYESSPMRYFYGFTSGDPFAHYVDTPGGAPGTQHREYSLGTVSITDGIFNLYVQDADILGGTYPIFGWAWVRLVPVEAELVVNCWEDDHQDPVLATFTSPALLNDHDGLWDEFWYQISRPFPAVFAGHNEWENYGLEPIHFFTTGIPDGAYEVWASLYTGRQTRHYYGWTEAEALAEARWVDNVVGAGGSDQFDEYLLGTALVTDGRFDLWVGDGDSSSPYFYGWAWIRLESAGLLMSSSSATMAFDADGDGIFGEPGDDVESLVDGMLTIMARDTTPGTGVTIMATDSAGRYGYNTYTIYSLNDPPVANDDDVVTDEDVPVTIDVLANDTDPDDNLVDASAVVISGPDYGAVEGTYGSFTYTPDANFNGSDSFDYEVCDTEDLCDTATVYITVNPVNDPPVAADDSYAATEDVPLVVAAPGVLANDSDVDGDMLSVDSHTQPANGVLTVDADGSFTYTPDPDYCGPDNASYTASDGQGGRGTAAVSFDVTCVNDPPVAADDSYAATEDVPLVVAAPGVLANDSDVDGDALYVDSYTQPANGDLELNADGSFTYTPDPDYCGSDGASYTVSDGAGGSGTAAISFDVACVNDPPVVSTSLVSQTVQYSDGIAEVTFTAVDIDSAGADITGSASGTPDALSLSDKSCTDDGDGTTCTWTLSGFVNVAAGTYDVTFTASDGDLDDSAATEIIVATEDARIRFDEDNPVSVRVVEDGGNSGVFSITVTVQEAYDTNMLEPVGEPLVAPGNIGLAEVSITLVPVGPGGPVAGICEPAGVTGLGYDAQLEVACEFDDVPVNTYVVQTTVGGDYYTGGGEDVLTVYDPSLGFATGGGWFYWPGTEDRTNFGFTMKYNKKGKNVQGSLLLIRHMADGTIYRVKSNALYGLAVGVGEGFGWASFSGKATYLEPGWPEPEGNHEFIVYIEDRNEPGTGVDRFWIEVHDKDGAIIDDMSMLRDATDNAVPIQGGNIVAPH
jgi:hypothetical protein